MDHKLGGMPYSLDQGVRESLDEFVAEGFFNPPSTLACRPAG
jgi:hypothetical protein